MFEEPTVLILGAGASTHFGLPIGEKLNSEITKGVQEALSHSSGSPFWNNFDDLQPTKQFLQQPYAFLLFHFENDPEVNDFINRGPFHRRMIEFSEALSQQSNYVIDQFLMENPEHREIGKICIAAELYRFMYSQAYKDAAVELRDFGEAFDENWYTRLINEIRDGATSSEQLEDETQLSIISFNYENTLELALERQLAATSIHKGADYRRCVNIIHPYGVFGKTPQKNPDFRSLILEAARNFLTLGESPSANKSKDYRSEIQSAKYAIANAKKVFILGFGFHRLNVDALGLSGSIPSKNTFCLNFDDSDRINTVLNQLRVPKENIRTKIGIHELIRDGFLSRMNSSSTSSQKLRI